MLQLIFLFSVVFCACDRRLFLFEASAHYSGLSVDERKKCHVRPVMTVQVPRLQLGDCLKVAADVSAFGAVVLYVAAAAAVVVMAVVPQFAVAAVVLCAGAAAVAVSAAGLFVTGVLAVHDVVAVAAAGPQALLTAFATGHCFAED